jgi:hypothetical protein
MPLLFYQSLLQCQNQVCRGYATLTALQKLPKGHLGGEPSGEPKLGAEC